MEYDTPGQVYDARPRVPFRIVRLLPATQQALLYDRNRSTHILAEIGKPLEGGFEVDDITDLGVTLLYQDTQIVLAASDDARPTGPRPVPHAPQPRAPIPAPQPYTPAVQPNQPYAPIADANQPYAPSPHPYEPYAPTAPAPAPAPAPYEVQPYVAQPPVQQPVVYQPPAQQPVQQPPVIQGNDPYTPALYGPNVPDDGYTVEPIAQTPASPSVIDMTLPRREFDVARSDFARLAAAVRVSPMGNHVRLDLVAPDSVFAKVGLRSGDVIVSIDGRMIRTLDDAAELYARAPGMQGATVMVMRSGRPLMLRVAIR